jgi:lysine-ketoglutarate reductase/saccharopine dehydrogenase-like protein (TIGR00300 family)
MDPGETQAGEAAAGGASAGRAARGEGAAGEGPISSVFQAKGHLIDSGLLSDALDAILAKGAAYVVKKLEVGRARHLESVVELEVEAKDQATYERVTADLLSLGFSETVAEAAQTKAVDRDGVAPEDFYSTTNLATQVRVGRRWVTVEDQRMDAAIVVEDKEARCVKLRDLKAGDQVVVGFSGILLKPSAPRRLRGHDRFEFMSGGISSERKLEAQVEQVVREWRATREAGGKVVLVAGPVVVHVGAAPQLGAILRSGQVGGLLAGNALAVHDVEAAMFGIDLQAGSPSVHGHMHHMRAINRIRAAGGLAAAVQKGILTSGVMHAAIQSKVPYCLAGSIRDDGPLPDTEMDLIRAQDRYAQILRDAGLVLILGTMLHGIGVGNMIPAAVTTVCVDIHPAVVAKLMDRGSSQSIGIVTDVGAFLSELQRKLLG